MLRKILGAAVCWTVVASGSALAGDCPDRAEMGKTSADAACLDTAKTSDVTTTDSTPAVTPSEARALPDTGTPARAAFSSAETLGTTDDEKYRYGPGAPPDPYGPDPNTWSATP